MPDLSVPCSPCHGYLRFGCNPESIYPHFISHFCLILPLPTKCVNIQDQIYTEELIHHRSLYCFHVQHGLCCFAKFLNTMANIAQFVCLLVETATYSLGQEKSGFLWGVEVDQGWWFSKKNRIKISSILIFCFCLWFTVVCVGGQDAWPLFGQTSLDKAIQRV